MSGRTRTEGSTAYDGQSGRTKVIVAIAEMRPTSVNIIFVHYIEMARTEGSTAYDGQFRQTKVIVATAEMRPTSGRIIVIVCIVNAENRRFDRLRRTTVTDKGHRSDSGDAMGRREKNLLVVNRHYISLIPHKRLKGLAI